MTELSTTPAPNRLVTSISKILLGCALMCAAVGYGAQAYAQQPRDLPPFDQEKAKTLSPEKRTEYDRLLFTELTYRGSSSRRHSIYTREAEWLAMAADGHELSYLVLTTASSGYGPYAPDKALTRLDQLATQGDTGAMCLYYWFVKLDDKRYPHAVQLLKRGSDLGQPECQRQYGQLLLPGVPKARKAGLKTDEERGYKLLMHSAEQAYAAPLNLYLYFKEKGYTKAPSIERAHCWATILYDNFEQDVGNDRFRTDTMFLEDVRDYAVKHRRQNLIELANLLKTRRLTLQQCLALGNN